MTPERKSDLEMKRLHLGRVQQLTSENDHMGALVHLSWVFRHSRAHNVFRALAMIRSVEMETTDDVKAVTDRWRGYLLAFIDTHYPELTPEVRRTV